MSITRVSSSRWKEAQKFEEDEWKREEGIVNKEWSELVKKFSKYFKYISKIINLKNDDRVLDLGCGPTVPSRLLGKGKIIGLEPLAKKLKIEGTTYIPGVKIVTGKGEKIPYKDQQFKIVVCRNVIDHTNDPEKIINECFRILKNDGYLLLICYTYTPFITFIKNLSEKYRFLNNVGHPFTYTPRSLENLSRDKFIIIETKTFYTGLNSTDYGKDEINITDNSLLHKILIWLNNSIFGYGWFLKEYGFLAKKNVDL